MFDQVDFGNLYRAIVTAAGTLATYLLGDMDKALLALITAVVLDYVTGVAAAYIRRDLSSAQGLRGMIKKFCMFAAVALANVIEPTGVLRTVVIWALVANESLSLIENLGTIGVQVPAPLRQAVVKLQATENDSQESER